MWDMAMNKTRRNSRAGRPAKAAGEKYSRPATAWFTPDGYVAVRLASKAERKSLSDWLRAAAELAIARGSTR